MTTTSQVGRWIRIDGEWHILAPSTFLAGDIVPVLAKSGETRLVQTSLHCQMVRDDESDPCHGWHILQPDPTAPARSQGSTPTTTSLPTSRAPLAETVLRKLQAMTPDDRFDTFDGAWGIGHAVPTRAHLAGMTDIQLRQILSEI
jgi:hypothetical protein